MEKSPHVSVELAPRRSRRPSLFHVATLDGKFRPYVETSTDGKQVRKYLGTFDDPDTAVELAKAADLLLKSCVVPFENFREHQAKTHLIVSGQEMRMADCIRQFKISINTVYKRARLRSQTPTQALADLIRERNPSISVEFV